MIFAAMLQNHMVPSTVTLDEPDLSELMEDFTKKRTMADGLNTFCERGLPDDYCLVSLATFGGICMENMSFGGLVGAVIGPGRC